MQSTTKTVSDQYGAGQKVPRTELTVGERKTLKQLEHVIESGLKSFFDVGQALMCIRDERLYKETHKTFEAYCQERWKFNRKRAHQLIQGASVVENVQNFGQTNTAPSNDAQARELAKLPADQQGEVWAEVVEEAGGVENVTAEQVKQAVKATLGAVDDNSHHTLATGAAAIAAYWADLNQRYREVMRQNFDESKSRLAACTDIRALALFDSSPELLETQETMERRHAIERERREFVVYIDQIVEAAQRRTLELQAVGGKA